MTRAMELRTCKACSCKYLDDPNDDGWNTGYCEGCYIVEYEARDIETENLRLIAKALDKH